MSVASIGFLGVGSIAAAMIHGLRARWPDLAIHLSPRSERLSIALAEADPLIRRASSNAVVVEASSVVVLAMRPPQLEAALRDLRFRPDQIAVSCVAATPLDWLAPRVVPARVCRLIPLPMIARCDGPLILYPALPEIQDLFADTGDLIVPPDEAGLAAYVAGSAAMSTILALQDTILGWIASRGATPEGADTYVRSLFRALSETAVRTEPAARLDLVARHETPGGLNARVRGGLAAEGWFDVLEAAFDRIEALGPADLATGNDG